MSVNKYANLPDIDQAPDIYETEDVFPSSQTKGDTSDDEPGAPSRPPPRTKGGDGAAGKEELDISNLMSSEEATKRFRRAEKKREHHHHHPRTQYTYPPSPTSPTSPSHVPPLSQRLRMLQNELASLEAELADPSNPQLHAERLGDNVDPGELVRGLVDIRGRLEKISKGKEGRGRLVGVVLGDPPVKDDADETVKRKAEGKEVRDKDTIDVKDIAEMDRRVGSLEKLVGSSSTLLDETSPLPPPLLPLLTRLNSQLTLLTQPRHIDSVSRRLKLLLSDLDRVSSANTGHGSRDQRRQSSQHSPSSPPPPSALQEQLAPLLTRLAPTLPQIPHILTRLRTLSALHASAGAFQSTLEGLEEEQKRTRAALEELIRAVEGVEGSLNENEKVVKGNVGGLEERVDSLLKRLDGLSR